MHFADDGISVTFPDLPSCFSYGNDEIHALSNAKEALELHIFGLEDDKKTIPKWLNDVAIENDVNFSQLLQVAIKNYLGISTNE